MIGIPQQQYKIEFLFPVSVVVLSLLNIGNQIFYSTNISYLSIFVSVIGIAGTICYFLKNNLFTTLLFIWSLAQLLVLESKVTNPVSHITYDTSPLDLTQGLHFNFYLFASNDMNSSSAIGINLMSTFYLGLVRVLSLSSLLGKEISITPFNAENTMQGILPVTGIIERRVTLSKEKKWMLTRLQTREAEVNIVQYALIKPKDNSILMLKKKQIVYFLLVPDINMIKDVGNLKSDFTDGAWAVVN